MNLPSTSREPSRAAPVQAAPGSDVHRPVSVTVLLFAAASEAAGCSRVDLAGATVGAVLAEARERFGPHCAAVLDRCRVWVNGEPSSPSDALHPGDEVALLPPVSGG